LRVIAKKRRHELLTGGLSRKLMLPYCATIRARDI
jgi:hypothetical protein